MQFVARAFVPALICFLIGVGMAAYILSSFALGGLFLLLALVAFFLSFTRRNRALYLLTGVCAVAIALGIFRFTWWANTPNDPLLEVVVGETVALRGMIIDEPDVRETNTQLRFAVKELLDGDAITSVKGNVLIIVNRYPDFRYGDELEIRGKIEHPKAFAGDDGRVFDYPNYLRAKGVAYQLFYPKVTMLERDKGNYLRAKLFATKHAFLDRLALTLPEPENALAGGILLGGKRSLGEEWTERFRSAGIVHIVVLSGYNMTIVAEWLGAAFLFLGFYGSLAISALGIVCFALMTGAGATVVRAAIMALLVLLARLTGRTGTMGRALLVAGTLMVLHNPSIIAFDPSFQLSFLASLGLVFMAPIVRGRIRIFRGHPIIEEVVVSTIATQIMVLPLILYQTGILSTIALFANILVLPLIPFTMLFTFLTGVLGFIGYFLALLVALPTKALLAWTLAVGKYGAALPFSVIHLPPLAGWLVFLLYAFIAFFIYRFALPTTEEPPQVL